MRSKLASVFVGLGVFLIVAAILVRFYAYPSLAKTPTDYESITKLEALDAQIFNSDPDVLAAETTDLSIVSRSVADGGADAPDDVSVWVNSTTISRPDGSVFQQARDRVAFDSVTGVATDCEPCDTWTEIAEGDRRDVERTGLLFKFPFGTEKKDYDVWDSSVNEAPVATFEGEEDLQGLTVYKFVQRIEPTVVQTREVPGSVFGSDEAVVEAEMWYEMTRTYYIEPQTGSPVNRVEERVQELRYDGTSVPAFTGTVQYTEDQVSDMVEDAKSNAFMLGGLQMLFPLVMGVLGALLIGLGLVMGRAAGGRSSGNRANDKTMAGV
ncbi:DUF3068 domain-containing protein [Nocardioides sp. zg-ZUI104]|uniref:DUF3068 domain-containing protein n=1 Tax=Nocardioides faecalis TaxID=2803858 RepID=UPI001BCDAA67|nr:DUF3068 domain-containing protein [Nocardioides faecalis]MBS4754393.1 DUF3068 domain-containing protein [Nocardioides faecalis]